MVIRNGEEGSATASRNFNSYMKATESVYFQFGLAILSHILELDMYVSAFSQTHK